VKPADLASELITIFGALLRALGDAVYYSAGLASLTAFAGAAGLPRTSIFWIVARILLDSAGGLFGLYLAVMVSLLLMGWAMRFRQRIAGHRPEPSA
jgi:hypothetical protein